MNTVIPREASWLLLPMALLICGTQLSHGFELFKPKGESEKEIKETTVRLKEIDQVTNGFADRYPSSTRHCELRQRWVLEGYRVN